MVFYIREGSELPYLDISFKGNDTKPFYETLLNSDISLKITTFDLCKVVINCGKIKVIEVDGCNDCHVDFFLRYKLPKLLTSSKGNYLATLQIKTNEGLLIMPENENIEIRII